MLNCADMDLPQPDLPYLRERFRELAAVVLDFCESGIPGEDMETTQLMCDAMAQLIDILDRIAADPTGKAVDAGELTTLGEYGLHLIGELSKLADAVDQADLRREIEHLSLPFALWIARHGGEIRTLPPVVNSLAHLANQSTQPQVMAALFNCCCEVIEALSPTCENPGATDPNDPWRLLLLNRAIVATRSHSPELIEVAYEAVIESLPADAEQFFAEGMEQMTTIDYPPQVREIVRRYYLAHTRPRHLH